MIDPREGATLRRIRAEVERLRTLRVPADVMRRIEFEFARLEVLHAERAAAANGNGTAANGNGKLDHGVNGG